MTVSPEVEDLLAQVAGAFNGLAAYGINVNLRYNAVLTDHGYVFPDGDGLWAARMKAGHPEEIPYPYAGDDD